MALDSDNDRQDRRPRGRSGSRSTFGLDNVMAMAFLFVATIYFLLPLYWLIVSATKPTPDLFSTFGLWFSHRWNLGANLQLLFTYSDHIYVRWLANTFLYAVVSALIGTALSAMAGYALAKFVFPGRNLIFSIVLGAILVPATALVLPLYLLMSGVGSDQHLLGRPPAEHRQPLWGLPLAHLRRRLRAGRPARRGARRRGGRVPHLRHGGRAHYGAGPGHDFPVPVRGRVEQLSSYRWSC